jgi:chromosome partitioning protein
MAQVLVVTNRKGGSGKTSTSVNLAAEFAANGRRVLLIDLDTQGHCAIGLGVKAQK